MKNLIRLSITLSIAANSLMAWNYYPDNWQYPTSYSQGCPHVSRPTFRKPMWPQTRVTVPKRPQQMAKSFEQQYPNVIIMFTKEDCPYCHYMMPIMKQAEAKFGQDIKFLFVDIAQKPQYATQYRFSTVPHIVYFKDGKQVDAHGSGDKTMTAEKVEQRIRNLQMK